MNEKRRKLEGPVLVVFLLFFTLTLVFGLLFIKLLYIT